MLLTLGEMFERYDRTYEGLVCCYKALHNDTDGSSLLNIARYVKQYLFTMINMLINYL